MVLCARSEDTLRNTAEELTEQFPDSIIAAETCDLSDPDEREDLVEFANRTMGGIDGLVNNAATSGPKGALDEIDWSEWMETFEVNLHASVDLCRRVLPIFRKQGFGKIVNVSGGGATSPMPRFSAYGVSKAALVRFTENLAEELAGTGIHVNALAPGMLATRLLREIVAEGAERIGEGIHKRMSDTVEKGGASLENAAELAVYLLSRASDGINGRVISAVWDPWRSLAEHIQEIAGTDVYTLRRIVPKDRGMEWGE